jgi:hypothetical protein
MKHILNFVRYKDLLKKEKNLNLENKSLLIENKDEFLEFLSYNSKLQNSISYQNKEKYYSLISQYLDNLIPPQLFQWKFVELEQKDAEAAKILLNDIKESQTFSIELIAIKFGSLVDKISELSDIANEFGPEEGISNENFLKSIKKIYSEMVALENQSE